MLVAAPRHRDGCRLAAPTSGVAVHPREHQECRRFAQVFGEIPVERSAQLILLLYLDKRGRPKVRIHGRPRSDRKRRFLLSAVAPSTSTRHPREARPTNWAQRGGLASGGKFLLTPRPHFTAPPCTLGNQVVRASDGPPFRQESRPTRLCRKNRAGRHAMVKTTWQPNEIQIEVNTAPQKRA
jgi:hypothetical protein